MNYIIVSFDTTASTQLTVLTEIPPRVAGDRFRFQLLRESTGVHLHPESLLPRAGSNTGRKIRDADRHVEPRLHLGGAVHRFPAAAGRGRGGSAGMHHRDAGHATAAAATELKTIASVHQLEGLPEVLHRDGDAGRLDSAKRGSVETREAARSTGLARSRARPQGLRRRAVPGLSQALSRVGAGVPDDAEQGTEASVAAPSIAEAAGR